jgi:predicted ArsR family transcriptional regulator
MLAEMALDMERALGALRDLTRRDILLRFYADRKARRVEEVAKEAHIHRSVAFEHLERLVTLGYLTSERRHGFPGKPAKVYRLTAGPVQISHPMRRYDLLAEALATEFLRLGEGADDAIKHAGLALGAALARPAAGSASAALEPLMELGGEYEIGPSGAIDCANCLFAEVCRRTPVICSFHAGVLEGLLDRSTVKGSVEALGHRGPNGCTYRIHRQERSESRSERTLTSRVSGG